MRKNQKGIATLLITIVILFVLGATTLYTNRSIIIEQKTSTNTYKHALALEAAQSGLEHFIGEISSNDNSNNYKKYLAAPSGSVTEWTLKTAYDNKDKANTLGYLNSTGLNTHNFDQIGLKLAKNLVLPLAKNSDGTQITGQKQLYNVYLYSIAPNSLIPGDKTRIVLVSQGCADNCAYANAFVVTEFKISETPICPLDINKKLTIDPSGSSIHAMTNSVPGFTCGISVGSVAGPNSKLVGCVANCEPGPSNDKFTPAFSETGSTSSELHFKKYFNDSILNVKNNTSTTCVINGPIDINSVATDPILALSGCTGKDIIFINGNLNVNANVGPMFTAGNKKLIVSGDLNLIGAMNMQGFLYVAGDTLSSTAGTLTILGGAAFGGDVTANGGINVTADASKSIKPSGGGLQANISSSSWRDF